MSLPTPRALGLAAAPRCVAEHVRRWPEWARGVRDGSGDISVGVGDILQPHTLETHLYFGDTINNIHTGITILVKRMNAIRRAIYHNEVVFVILIHISYCHAIVSLNCM